MATVQEPPVERSVAVAHFMGGRRPSRKDHGPAQTQVARSGGCNGAVLAAMMNAMRSRGIGDVANVI